MSAFLNNSEMRNHVNEFNTIKTARALVKTREASKASEKTIAEYLKNMESRLHRDPDTAFAWTTANKKRTAYKLKAAAMSYIATELAQLLSTQDKIQKSGGTEDTWKAIIHKINVLLDTAEEYNIFDSNKPSDGPGKFNQNKKGNNSVKNHKKGGAVSKRKGLHKLPFDWREQIAKAMDYPILLDVVAVCGARPSELQYLQIHHSEDTGEAEMMFLIQGTKTSEGRYGQEERRVTVNGYSSPAALRLRSKGIELLDNVSKDDLKRFSEKLRRVSSKLFHGSGYTVSLYSFRHAFAEAMKSSGLPLNIIACALGHCVTETQKKYGHVAKFGKGQMCPIINACGITPVRENHARTPTRAVDRNAKSNIHAT